MCIAAVVQTTPKSEATGESLLPSYLTLVNRTSSDTLNVSSFQLSSVTVNIENQTSVG